MITFETNRKRRKATTRKATTRKKRKAPAKRRTSSRRTTTPTKRRPRRTAPARKRSRRRNPITSARTVRRTVKRNPSLQSAFKTSVRSITKGSTVKQVAGITGSTLVSGMTMQKYGHKLPGALTNQWAALGYRIGLHVILSALARVAGQRDLAVGSDTAALTLATNEVVAQVQQSMGVQDTAGLGYSDVIDVAAEPRQLDLAGVNGVHSLNAAPEYAAYG